MHTILHKPVLFPLQAVFLYFIINVLWVVATFFLQAIGSDVLSIKIPKYFPNGTLSDEPLKVEPLSLMFLLSFAILLIVQFLAMLYHRYDNTVLYIMFYQQRFIEAIQTVDLLFDLKHKMYRNIKVNA